MEAYIAIGFLATVLTLTFSLVRWKGNRDKERVSNYLFVNEVDAEVIKAGVPPLRLWLKNRKGDGWVKIAYSDGVEQWVRVRNHLFSERTFEFFD